MRKILITAKDPASANDVSVVIDSLLLNKKYTFKILAQKPAYDILKNRFLSEKKILSELIEFEKNIYGNILLTKIFDDFSPDFLLTGISGPEYDFGIDEIALKKAHEYRTEFHKIKTFSIQSWWGNLNQNLGVLAQTIFVIDNFAKKITLDRNENINAVVTGPIQFMKYKSINIVNQRQKFRKQHIKTDEKIIGFFSQPLFEFNWYKKTLISFFKSLDELNFPFKILYKPHPKETIESKNWTIKQIKYIQSDFILVDEGDALNILPSTDLVVSLFSTVGFDLQNLIAQSPVTFSAPIYLFYEKDCRKWFEADTTLKEIPMTYDSMALVVLEESEILEKLILGMDNKFQIKCQQKLKNIFSIEQATPSCTILRTFDEL